MKTDAALRNTVNIKLIPKYIVFDTRFDYVGATIATAVHTYSQIVRQVCLDFTPFQLVQKQLKLSSRKV